MVLIRLFKKYFTVNGGNSIKVTNQLQNGLDVTNQTNLPGARRYWWGKRSASKRLS